MSVLPCTFHTVLGSRPDESAFENLLHIECKPDTIKAYPDIVYYNYTSMGFSLQYTPSSSYKPARTASKRSALDESQLSLSTIDIYTSVFDFSSKACPITFTYTSPSDDIMSSNPQTDQVLQLATIELTALLTGRDLVSALGEPDRKGGGESKAMGVWLEWTGLGLMTEFTTQGSHRWDKEHGAGNASVHIYSFFEPSKEASKHED